MKLFKKEKIDEQTKIYTILGLKFKRVRKPIPVSQITKAKVDDAVIAAKCLRNLAQKESSVETMVLGHSHARLGFVENEKSINFGIDSQDLYYSYEILKKYCDILPKLKNIVLFFAVFSPGNDIEKSPQAYRCAYYDVFFGIPYKNRYLAVKNGVVKLASKFYNLPKKFSKRFFKKLNEVPSDLMNSDIKNENPTFMEQRWINRWIDLNRRNTQIHFVEKMAEICKEQGLNFTIVLSPYNPRIKEFLPHKNECYKSLFEITSKYDLIKILDEYSCSDFDEDDFLDIEHLSVKGAQKMTEKIKVFMHNFTQKCV